MEKHFCFQLCGSWDCVICGEEYVTRKLEYPVVPILGYRG